MKSNFSKKNFSIICILNKILTRNFSNYLYRNKRIKESSLISIIFNILQIEMNILNDFFLCLLSLFNPSFQDICKKRLLLHRISLISICSRLYVRKHATVIYPFKY